MVYMENTVSAIQQLETSVNHCYTLFPEILHHSPPILLDSSFFINFSKRTAITCVLYSTIDPSLYGIK